MLIDKFIHTLIVALNDAGYKEWDTCVRITGLRDDVLGKYISLSIYEAPDSKLWLWKWHIRGLDLGDDNEAENARTALSQMLDSLQRHKILPQKKQSL